MCLTVYSGCNYSGIYGPGASEASERIPLKKEIIEDIGFRNDKSA